MDHGAPGPGTAPPPRVRHGPWRRTRRGLGAAALALLVASCGGPAGVSLRGGHRELPPCRVDRGDERGTPPHASLRPEDLARYLDCDLAGASVTLPDGQRTIIGDPSSSAQIEEAGMPVVGWANWGADGVVVWETGPEGISLWGTPSGIAQQMRLLLQDAERSASS